MRGAAAACAVALLAACAPADTPVASPSPSPTVTVAPKTDLELVRAAYLATRAAKTGTFVVKGVTAMALGSLTLRRDGSYDLGRKAVSMTQAITANPPDLLAQVTGEEQDDRDLTVRTVVTATAGYLQMPGWQPPANDKWLRFTAGDIEGLTGIVPDLDSAVFPPAVDVLKHAEASGLDGTGRSEFPPVLHVVVPAGAALLALPSSSARAMLDAGVDLDSLDGEVEVEVEVTKGVVRAVRYDALDALEAALAEAGEPDATRGLTHITADVALDDAGKPVRIVVPPAAQVMSKEEFEARARR